MSKPSRYSKKRKHELDEDSSSSKGKHESPKKSRRRESSGSPPPKGGASNDSISIEETNKLRAQIGLPPLEVDNAPKKDADSDGDCGTDAGKEVEGGGKIVVEDGLEFVHKPTESWTQKKASEKIKERLDTQAAKRRIHSKVLKTKGLAESSDESGDEGAASWIERSRKLEEERRKAAQKAAELDALDEEVARVPKPKSRPSGGGQKGRNGKSEALTSGLTVGHSKEAFMTGEETILVLDDKSVLDEDGEEVLVNPTLMYNEQLKKNRDVRERKTDYNPYEEEEVDDFGVVKKKAVLSKYDEGLDGPTGRETFRLGSDGGVNLVAEEEEERVKRNLFMANRKLQSLETAKYKVASEFYTEEEMISFRKPKKKKDGSKSRRRKGKTDELALQPEEETAEERRLKQERLKARRQLDGGAGDADPATTDDNGQPAPKPMEADKEDGEIVDDQKLAQDTNGRFRDTMKGAVDTNKMRSLLSKIKDEAEAEEDDEDDFEPVDDLAGVVIDDDGEDELNLALEKARRLKTVETKRDDDVGRVVARVKSEPDDEDMDVDEEDAEGGKRIVLDATSEFYKTIGDTTTSGLAGNRDEETEAAFAEAAARRARQQARADRRKEKERKKSSKRRHDSASDDERRQRHKSSRRRSRSRSKSSSPDMTAEKSEKDSTYENVLGKEQDVTKGVAGMLRLAGEKGYLEDPSARKKNAGVLKHLESKSIARVEFKYDIEDKYLKKMERVGAGGGPIRPFPEKRDYTPKVEIAYTDGQGREMDPKAAFRTLSHKFHGKAPGKKQIEKRMRQQDKKERLKKMNSSDTPLGTLSKQVKKQEQLQTPYLVLSGGSQNAPLQKD